MTKTGWSDLWSRCKATASIGRRKEREKKILKYWMQRWRKNQNELIKGNDNDLTIKMGGSNWRKKKKNLYKTRTTRRDTTRLTAILLRSRVFLLDCKYCKYRTADLPSSISNMMRYPTLSSPIITTITQRNDQHQRISTSTITAKFPFLSSSQRFLFWLER